MPNQTGYNNKATSNVVYFRSYIQNSTEAGDCCFDVVDTVSELGTIQNPEIDHIAIIWNPSSNSVPSIAIYLGNGNWAIKTLKGEKGETGAQGAPGQDGEQGAPGQPGANGTNGTNGVTPGHRWVGTQLQFQNPDGSWGIVMDLKGATGATGANGQNGAKGDKPAHEWSGTQLRFEKPDGTWGIYTDLRGAQGIQGNPGAPGANGANGLPPAHQIDATNFRLRFQNPDGSWGAWIVYGSAMSNTNGILNLEINIDRNTLNDVSSLVNSQPQFQLPAGSLLHIVIITMEWESDTYPEFNKTPRYITKWWYKEKGERLMGSGSGSTVTSGSDFINYYDNTFIEPLVNSISTRDIGAQYFGMGYLQSDNTLNKFINSTYRINTRNLFESIRLKFRWGKGGLQNIADLANSTAEWDLSDHPNMMADSYALGYGEIENGVLVIKKLHIEIPQYHKIKGKSPVLIIDRYKKRKLASKSLDDGEHYKFRSAGYRLSARIKTNPGESRNNIFENRIPITDRFMVLDDINCKLHNLFDTIKAGESDDPRFLFRPKGGRSNQSSISSGQPGTSMAFVRLRFRIQWCETDISGRKKLFKTSDNGQIGVQVVRVTGAEEEGDFAVTVTPEGDAEGKIVGGGSGGIIPGGGSTVYSRRVRLITFKMI